MKPGKKVVYTLGYQGINLETYVGILKAAGVGLVVDVREVPWSRKPGFSKAQLQAALQTANIAYIHIRSAGNPSSNRKTAKSPADCLRRYRTYLQQNDECLDILLDLIGEATQNGRPACLTCFERLPDDCHRSILIDFLSARCSTLSVFHLPEESSLFSQIADFSVWDTTTRQL
jgi:uncharacterized protein (DUF488 family)